MIRRFDVIAIGIGSAASAVASRCREAGWQVAIVDSRPFGGTCALRGCDPKKVLVGAAEAVDWSRRMKGRGIQAARLEIDWPELMRFKRTFTEPVPKRREDGFAKAGITAFHGRARFAGSNRGPWRRIKSIALSQALSNAFFDSLGLSRLASSR
jgi:glutathione reductase (NADPH)